MWEIRSGHFPLEKQTEAIIRLAFEVHNTLGSGFQEIVYKDALEYEFIQNGIVCVREKEYLVNYKETVLKHRFYADFVVSDSVILEIKAKESIANDDISQGINYLKCSGCKVALILNFGKKRMEIKRLVF